MAFVTTGKTSREVRLAKQNHAQEIQQLLREFPPPDPCEEWHIALAAVVEAVDIWWLSPDTMRQTALISAVDRARYLLKDD